MKLETADDYIAHIRSDAFDVSSKHDGATFWSGNYVANDVEANGASNTRTKENGEIQHMGLNETRAHKMASSGEYSKLELTEGGKWLESQDLSRFSREERSAIWSAASEKYAENASGDVTTRVVGSGESSVFRSKEIPTLLENEKVTGINGVPREELKTLHANDPKAAYEKVCDAELANSRREVAATGGPEAKADLETREGIHRDAVRRANGLPDSRGDLYAPRATPAAANDNAPPSGPAAPAAAAAPTAANDNPPAQGGTTHEFSAPPMPPPPPPPAADEPTRRVGRGI